MWLLYLGLFILLTWIILGLRGLPGLIRSTNLSDMGSDFDSRSEAAIRLGSNLRSDSSFDSDFAVSSDHHKRGPSETLPPTNESPLPIVSIVLAAKNEARALPHTLRSLQNQTYPNIEIIVVNDRSTDETPQVLEDIAADWPELRVIHIQALPEGWLGKNYALHSGSQVATGDWILFTDADVRFDQRAVETAMQYATHEGIHHLTLAPRLVAKGFWLSSVVYLFLFNVVMVFRPQDADRPNSSAFVGIGAFNLVRKNVYENVGGHKNVANRPDDDLALGHAIKTAGFHQKFAGGTRLLQVEWYENLRQMAYGLEKNSLAPFQYKFWKFTAGVVLFLLVYAGPAAGLLFAPGWERIPYALALACEVFLFHMSRRFSGVSTLWGFTLPLATPVLFYILVRSALLTAIRGGITWRGTFYALEELRRQTK